MQSFKNFVAKRRIERIEAYTDRITRVNTRLDHMDPSSPDAAALRKERVQLFWKRNDLYRKLYDSKETTHVRA